MFLFLFLNEIHLTFCYSNNKTKTIKQKINNNFLKKKEESKSASINFGCISEKNYDNNCSTFFEVLSPEVRKEITEDISGMSEPQ